jgi:hypothetical protein
MSKTEIITDENIISKIYLVRDKKVMLDRDLAEIYGVETRRLNEQVKRNIERFPDHFMFTLTEEEVDAMVSQNAIPSKQVLGGSLPKAFTEHGVLMLANVLRSEQAIKMSIRLIEVFVKIREMMLTNKDILLKLEGIEKSVNEHDENIQVIFEALRQLLDPPKEPRKRIGYKSED